MSYETGLEEVALENLQARKSRLPKEQLREAALRAYIDDLNWVIADMIEELPMRRQDVYARRIFVFAFKAQNALEGK